MNTKIKSYRGAGFTLAEIIVVLAIVALLAAIALPQCAQAQSYVPSQGIYIDASTNTVSVGGTNAVVSRVPAAQTNTFNLSNTLQGQSDTNSWPALPLTPRGKSGSKVAITWQFTASAATTGQFTIRCAASSDGTRWISNYAVFNPTANGTATITGGTNHDFGAFPFVAIQSLENTNATAIITNLVLSANFIPGI